MGQVVDGRFGHRVDGRGCHGLCGSSSVNQAPITSESVPVEKSVDSDLFAGTINGDGALEAVSTKRAEDTTLARIIQMVEEAHGRRANVEQWVEKLAAVYTPAVIVLAIAVTALPPLAFGAPWIDWFYRALVLLVIACPCALVISTPVSIVAALAAAARNGVLIKGGVFIEVPAKLKALALDKTGTIDADLVRDRIGGYLVVAGQHDEMGMPARRSLVMVSRMPGRTVSAMAIRPHTCRSLPMTTTILPALSSLSAWRFADASMRHMPNCFPRTRCAMSPT
jgi:high-affinity K+ transport system ATPase subunit B